MSRDYGTHVPSLSRAAAKVSLGLKGLATCDGTRDINMLCTHRIGVFVRNADDAAQGAEIPKT